jgi:hypothetical protein
VEFLKIVAGCIVAAVVYGVVHDQITARVYVEYFTVFHPPVFHTQSPTLLAFGWGVIASWWMGAFLGVLLAIACRAGSLPKISLSNLLRPIAILLLVMGSCALMFGLIGFLWARAPEGMADLLSPSAERRFLADWWAHSASYASGLFGGIVLCFVSYRRRLRMRLESAGCSTGIAGA